MKIMAGLMRLFDLKTGMNTRRVRIFLSEKNLQLPMYEVDMAAGENSRPGFLAMNPMGTMPVLELDDGTFLSESVAICRYVEEQLAPEPNLFGLHPRERAEVEMWNRRMEMELLLPIATSFQHLSLFWKGRINQVAAAGELAREKALTRMTWLDDELSDRQFIAGSRYTIADITAQCALILGKNTGTPIDVKFIHLARWFKEVSSRPTARA
jgi:glutathione S-transferase